MTRGLIRISVFSIFLLGVDQLLRLWVGPGILHGYLHWIIVFFWVVSLGIHVLSEVAQRTLDMDKTLVLLGAVTARLLIAIFAMVTVALIGIADRSLFIINFAVLYLCYLVFEISSVLSNLRSNLK
ncbi:hypothetical protein [Reichenbachiella ulvae]|uniref:Uncharacterized protein n=1 Tax=Reichenbachiella ulvae TaxID=2980104 RepID=A0ABT3CYA2_9BACT|nr:hypothetical protein [Reichenbachiella ulvae]MCV9388675.1 hypothetical protein [Reichenbachiella ulvae]